MRFFVSIKSYQKAVATGLTPLMSKLTLGTEFSNYKDPQWHFLLGGGDVKAFVVPDEDGEDQLHGCLLRIDLKSAAAVPTLESESKSGDENKVLAAGFGMMLVSPAARGRGVAKLLLNEAISADPEGMTEDDAPVRKLLAVCTKLGQPVYRKLGFSDVGRVTALSAEIGIARDIPLNENTGSDISVETYGSMDEEDAQRAKIDLEIRNLLVDMDSKATGYDRTERLSFMLKNDPNNAYGSRSIVATAKVDENVIASAIMRRDEKGGPYVIGPMMGSEQAALPLIKALARAVPENDTEVKKRVSILVSDHQNFVDSLKCVKFVEGFSFPAMSLDGKPIYNKGDGSYLGLIHPTLG